MVKIFGIGLIIKLLCCFVKMVGLLVLYDFFYCGFSVFKGLGDVSVFIEFVIVVEFELNDVLFDECVNLIMDNFLFDVWFFVLVVFCFVCCVLENLGIRYRLLLIC